MGNSQENTSWGECIKENGRGDGIWTYVSEAKWKGFKRTRNTSLLILPSDNGGGRKKPRNCKFASITG